MKFNNTELNERIKLFSTSEYKNIISNENPNVYELEKISKNIFSSTTRFNVVIENVIYECVLSPSKSKQLYVFLSGAASRYNMRAGFDRVSWHQYFNGCCINIEDPTYKENNVNSCWGGYFGTGQKSYIDGVEAIVHQIQDIYGIPNINVFFIGSSAGGFASLHIAARNDGYKCLVRNPQIFLGERELSMIGKLRNMDFTNSCFKERLDLGNSIVRNKTSKFIILFNRYSDWDLGNLNKLLAKFEVEDVSRNYYHFGNKHIVVMETDIKVPHNNHCCPFVATILTRMDMYPPDDLEHMLLSFIKANQERRGLIDGVEYKEKEIADLKKRLEQRETDLRENAVKDLWTARLDIKNHGKQNEVIVTNLQEDRPLDITKPEWFNDMRGQGVVIEGVTGYARMSLRFVGSGTLKIDLRGITRFGTHGERLPYWITFLSLCIDGKDILSRPVDVWHDQPVTCQKMVENGEIMMLEVRWCPCARALK